MAYEMVMPYHLHMPSYFLETFTEYPYQKNEKFYGSCSSVIGGKVKNLNIKKIPKLLVSGSFYIQALHFAQNDTRARTIKLFASFNFFRFNICIQRIKAL